MSDQFTSETALVLFSGGQDSATCLAWPLDRFRGVDPLAFDCGQRQAVELAGRAHVLEGLKGLRPEWAVRLGDGHALAIPALAAISDPAVPRNVAIARGADGLPSPFLPGRNL